MSEQIALKQSLIHKPQSGWLTSGQVKWRAVQICLVGSYLLGVLLINFDGVSILFRHPIGQKMLVGAFVMMALGLGGQVLGCLALNKILPPDNPSLTIWRNLLTWAMEGTLVVLFVLPLMIVFLVGPATLKIVDTLSMP
jgi:hypothetical protein